MLEERVQIFLKKLDKEIKHNKALAKRVVGFMRKEREEKAEPTEKEEASKKENSCSKNEATKDMVS
jgi:hypothetical protein